MWIVNVIFHIRLISETLATDELCPNMSVITWVNSLISYTFTYVCLFNLYCCHIYSSHSLSAISSLVITESHSTKQWNRGLVNFMEMLSWNRHKCWIAGGIYIYLCCSSVWGKMITLEDSYLAVTLWYFGNRNDWHQLIFIINKTRMKLYMFFMYRFIFILNYSFIHFFCL